MAIILIFNLMSMLFYYDVQFPKFPLSNEQLTDAKLIHYNITLKVMFN